MEVDVGRGRVALVDDEDVTIVAGHSWHVNDNARGLSYAVTNLPRGSDGRRSCLYMHRLLLNLDRGDPRVDHRNANGLDNRRCNLRLATPTQNQANRRKRAGTSRYRGVWWNDRRYLWQVGIVVAGSRRHLGYFADEEEAAAAWDCAAVEAWGDYARRNLDGS